MEVRKAKESDWQKINEFLDKSLRPQNKWSLHHEYPLAFSERNRKNIYFIEDEDQVLAHAVLHPTIIKTHYHLFKVGLIGSVVTDESQRGKGLSREIIENCLKAAKEQKCDISILWTDMFNFYARFGFEIAGSEIALQVDESFKPQNKKSLKVLETAQVSPQALLKLFNKHQLRSVRSPSDIQKFLNIPQTEVYTAWNAMTNELEAYCVMGKGADFTNYIHEWGGQVTSIMSLVKHISEKKIRESSDPQTIITLISPPQCQNLIRKMQEAGAHKYLGVLGMIAINNPESFCAKIKKGARALGYDEFIFDYQSDRYFFGYGDEIYQTDSPQDITRLVFGPAQPEQIHNFSKRSLEALNEIFPIPFWVWGWDSI
jgi:N-acetylglutamate synthase-like GNAT family acetyltransferase